MKKDLILVGIQGSGKGTQARILAEKFGYTIFQTGAELRRLSREHSSLGQKIKTIIDGGDLVSNEIVMEIVENFLKNIPATTPIIFDGVPRFDEQRLSLEALLREKQRSFIVLEIHLSEQEALKRLLKRAEIEKRADDNPEGIKRRIHNFYEHTRPMLSHWEKEGVLFSVNGENSIEVVTANIFTTLPQ